MNKNFKSLELQIKQICEYLNNRDEQSQNWKLAKKQFGGFSCASFETYLGDLKKNNEKVFWNQLPDRELVTTNANKIGNGFSRILNLVNINKDLKTIFLKPFNFLLKFIKIQIILSKKKLIS